MNHTFLENTVKKLICFKNPAKPTCIEMIITNKLVEMFRIAKMYETGLSDFYKLFVSVMKLSYKKRPPRMIKCRDYKKFSNKHFKNSLNENLAVSTELNYNSFEEIILNILSSQAPFNFVKICRLVEKSSLLHVIVMLQEKKYWKRLIFDLIN